MESHISTLTTDRQIFRAADGTPVRLKGFSGFKLLRQIADGEDVSGLLDFFRSRGSNTVRMWPYVEWPSTGWTAPGVDEQVAAIRYLREQGFWSYVTLLTSDTVARVEDAKRLVTACFHADLDCVLFEIGNEPQINKHIDTRVLYDILERSGFLYTSGEYDDTARWFGKFGDAHTPRDGEWPRKSHDLHEYYVGGGPSYPTEPATRVPWIAGEPIRPDQAGFDAEDFLAYGALCALLGAGAVFHYEGGKYGRAPEGGEITCADAFFQGLNAFPADAPNLAYERIDERGETLRTYKKGPYYVRVRPRSGPILRGETV